MNRKTAATAGSMAGIVLSSLLAGPAVATAPRAGSGGHAATPAGAQFAASAPGGTSFELFSAGSQRGRMIHLAGVGISRNLNEFAMCFLCGSWDNKALSIANGGTPVWLYRKANRTGEKFRIAPWAELNLAEVGIGNDTSSYYLGDNPPS